MADRLLRQQCQECETDREDESESGNAGFGVGQGEGTSDEEVSHRDRQRRDCETAATIPPRENHQQHCQDLGEDVDHRSVDLGQPQ